MERSYIKIEVTGSLGIGGYGFVAPQVRLEGIDWQCDRAVAKAKDAACRLVDVVATTMRSQEEARRILTDDSPSEQDIQRAQEAGTYLRTLQDGMDVEMDGLDDGEQAEQDEANDGTARD